MGSSSVVLVRWPLTIAAPVLRSRIRTSTGAAPVAWHLEPAQPGRVARQARRPEPSAPCPGAVGVRKRTAPATATTHLAAPGILPAAVLVTLARPVATAGTRPGAVDRFRAAWKARRT